MIRLYTTLSLFIVSVFSVVSAYAQLTAPVPVHLTYKFNKGDTLSYEHGFEMNQNGQIGASGYNAMVVVENTDADGNITLLIMKVGKTTQTSYSTNASSTEANNQTIVDDNETLRVTMDKYGYYIKSTHLAIPQNIKDSRERLKQSGNRGDVIADSSMAKHLVKDLFPKLPRNTSITVGEAIVDTVVILKEITSYTVANAGASTGYSPPPMQTTDKEVTIDSIVYLDDVMVNNERCRKLKIVTSYKQSELRNLEPLYSISTVLIRERDCAIVSRIKVPDESRPSSARKKATYEETLTIKRP